MPSHAPPDFQNRSALWNSVEKIEKSKNSQLAREIELAIPKELPPEQQIKLVREYVNDNFVSVGMCADIAIHDKNDGNPHAHIMLTMRPLNENGEWGAKSKKEYITDKNGERIKLKNGNFKTKKLAEQIQYLQDNKIFTIPQLDETVNSIRDEYDNIRITLKEVEGRLKSLAELVKQAEIYRKHRELYKQYGTKANNLCIREIQRICRNGQARNFFLVHTDDFTCALLKKTGNL